MDVRSVRIEDGKLLYEWRNHPKVKKYFFDSDDLSFSSHMIWLESTLASECRKLLLVYNANADIGVLRYDLVGKKADVSIYLNPLFIGKGLGRVVLESGTTWLKQNCSEVNLVRAKILPDNNASIKTFESVGFLKTFIQYEMEI